MRSRVVIGIFLGAAVVGLLVLAVAVKTFDLNQYREQITDQVRSATGRELTLRGKLELGISLQPRIAINGASFGNAAWGSRPEMLTVGRAEVSVALWPLLMGDVEVRHVALIDAEVLLETDAQGEGNWVMGPDAVAGAAGAAQGDRRGVGLDRVDVENLSFTWRDGTSGETTQIQLQQLTLFPPEADQSFVRIFLIGEINAQPIQVSGALTPIRDILRGEPLVAHLRVATNGASVAVDGTVRRPLEARGVDLRFSGEGTDLTGISGLAGLTLPEPGPWRLSFGLTEADGGWAIGDLKAQLGESDLAGRFSLAAKAERLRIEGELSAEMVDLDRLAGTSDRLAAGPSGHRERVFSPEPLALDGLKSFDADLALDLGAVRTGGLTIRPLSATLKLDRGVLEVVPITGVVEGGAVDGKLVLDVAKPIPVVSIRLDGRNIQIGPVLTASLGSQLISGAADLDVELRGRGRSVAAMMASLSGHARLLVGKGHAQIEDVDQIVGGLSQLAGQLAGQGADRAAMNCMASDFDVRAGVAEARVLLLDTVHSTVKGEGRIDLGTERLDLVVKPQPKSATLNVAVPVQVGGTLVEPTFRPEKFATARKVGGLLGILVYPPAALAGLGELGGGDNPCITIAAGGGSTGSGEKKSLVKKTADGVTDAVKGIGSKLKGIGSKLKGLFGD